MVQDVSYSSTKENRSIKFVLIRFLRTKSSFNLYRILRARRDSIRAQHRVVDKREECFIGLRLRML